ncbi:MAG: FAD-dependent oxidoreductase [Deinococcales bacterium]
MTPRILVNEERCVGCQECVIRCPAGALDLDSEAWKAVGNDTLCVGCRQCTRTCPYGAIEIEGPMLVAPRVEVAQPVVGELLGSVAPTRRGFGYAEAMQEAERCLNCPDPTCVLGCPAHNDIPGFIAAIRDEDWDGAHAVLRRTSVMPDICSIVCDQSVQCEGACSWKLAGGEPVAIGMLERFVTEQRPVPEVRPAEPAPGAQRVAVVGSGPAGMAAAWELIEKGARVTMIERESATGGVLGWGIPDFTLPEHVATRPMAALQRAGLDLQTGIDVDEARLTELRRDFDAVILAQGASNPAPLPVPGADADGVEDATSFLRRAKLALATGKRQLDDLPHGTHVLVVGAGNTAMDVARSARRLGCETTAIDWFDRRFAVVRDDELLEAEDEGVRISFNRVVDHFETDDTGHVVAAHLMHTRQRRADARPKQVAGSAERLEVGLVVLATGYRVGGPLPHDAAMKLPVRAPDPKLSVPERTLLGSGLPAGSRRVTELVRRRAYLERRSEQPVAASVWAAGDGLSGPSTVVGSMAQGLAAARSLLLAAAVRDSAVPPGAGAQRPEAHGEGRGRPVAGNRLRNAPQPTWPPRLSVAGGLVAEIAGVIMLAATHAWIPAVILFGAGTVGSLAGLNGWVGGWVRAQDQ